MTRHVRHSAYARYGHLPRVVRAGVAIAALFVLVACCAGAAIWIRGCSTGPTPAASPEPTATALPSIDAQALAQARTSADEFYRITVSGQTSDPKAATTGAARAGFDAFVARLKAQGVKGLTVRSATKKGDFVTVVGYERSGTSEAPKYRKVTLTMRLVPIEIAGGRLVATFMVTRIAAAGGTVGALP